jgi:hypothetical protein
MIRPGRLWWWLRKDWKRGWAASWADHVLLPRIRSWKNPHRAKPLEPVPVHVLAGGEQFWMMCWMLASWFRVTGRNWRVVVQDDGSLEEWQVRHVEEKWPGSTLVRSAAAGDRMVPLLAPYPCCARYRAAHPLARKIFDAPVLADGGRFILLDTDVLFFSKPVDMLEWVDGKSGGSWFNEDVAEASLVSPEEALAKWNVRLIPRVNSGVCLVEADTVDLDFCEQALRESGLLGGLLWRVEQTLFALCASRAGRGGGLLPSTYEVSLGSRRAPEAICRHYVGAVRDRFYAEGVRELAGVLL